MMMMMKNANSSLRVILHMLYPSSKPSYTLPKPLRPTYAQTLGLPRLWSLCVMVSQWGYVKRVGVFKSLMMMMMMMMMMIRMMMMMMMKTR